MVQWNRNEFLIKWSVPRTPPNFMHTTQVANDDQGPLLFLQWHCRWMPKCRCGVQQSQPLRLATKPGFRSAHKVALAQKWLHECRRTVSSDHHDEPPLSPTNLPTQPSICLAARTPMLRTMPTCCISPLDQLMRMLITKFRSKASLRAALYIGQLLNKRSERFSMYVCMYVCMYVWLCMYVCMYVCMYRVFRWIGNLKKKKMIFLKIRWNRNLYGGVFFGSFD